MIFYFWLVPESIRWLLITGRVERAIKILKRTASVNGKQITESSIEAIIIKYSNDPTTRKCPVDEINNSENESESMFQSLYSIFQSKTLCLRFLNCYYQWVTCCCCYYGIGLISTHVPGENHYTSFLIVASLEIPTLLITLPLLNRKNRKTLMFAPH